MNCLACGGDLIAHAWDDRAECALVYGAFRPRIPLRRAYGERTATAELVCTACGAEHTVKVQSEKACDSLRAAIGPLPYGPGK